MRVKFRQAKPAIAVTAAAPTLVLALCAVVLGWLPFTAAGAPLAELHTADQIRRLSSQQADLHYPVRLRGVITYFDDRIPMKTFRFVQDQTAGIYFYADGLSNNAALHTGQLVEIEGETGSGSFAPVVLAHRIAILGETNLPNAKPVSMGELASGLEDSQFVEVRGVVRSVWYDKLMSDYVIELATGEGQLALFAAGLPVARSEDLVDCDVRAKAVCWSRFNSQRQLFDIGLMIPLPEDLAIDRPPPSDPQSLTAQPIKSLLQYTWGGPIGHLVKVKGTVTLREPDKMYIQDETEGLCVETRQNDKAALGDKVEVLGFAAKGEYTPKLENGIFRTITHGPELKPELVTPDEALTGAHDCRLVQIKATLLDRALHAREPFLVLQANGFVFHAQFKSLLMNLDFASLQNGSKVSVTGVCAIDDIGEGWYSDPGWRAASFRLLLRSPADVVVLQRPPWWNLPKLIGAMGILCAVLLTAIGWVALLRRRVHQQTQIIEEKLHAEAASKERYLGLFENANDMVFTHDLKGKMTSINQAGERMLQRPRADILTEDLIDLIAEDERTAAREWLKQVTAGAETAAVDWDFVNAAGQKLKLEVSSRLVEQGGKLIEVEGVARDVTARKRMEQEILEISSREQQRLGHDLHDGVCQQLAAIAYRTHVLARHLKETSAAESSEADDISHLINESLVQTRTVARGLFPVRLEEDGLQAAVEELAVGAGKLYKIKCNFSSSGTLPTLHSNVAMHLHFIAQEAILNAAKHSTASMISVRLERENDDLILSVQDNGTGFQAADLGRTGMGIGIMRYRARAIGAILKLHTQPGRGTLLSCKFHLQARVETKRT